MVDAPVKKEKIKIKGREEKKKDISVSDWDEEYKTIKIN